jgi:D-proline reductase (dithiol) PrdB
MSTESTLRPADVPAYDFDRLRIELGLEPLSIPRFDPLEVEPLAKDLSDARVGLLVTAGAYYPDQRRLGATNDLTYRLLPRDRDLADILFAHMTPVRAFALADPNVAYPRDRMLELEEEGTIGSVADNAVSIVGSISKWEELATDLAPRIVEEFQDMGVDLVLVLPFCPACHLAAGVLARAIEKRGLPTTSINTFRKPALALKAPRSTWLDFPLGCPAGKPREPELQRDVLRTALQEAVAAPAQWELRRLPFDWSPDADRSWETLVDTLYKVDNEIRGTLKRNSAAHDKTESALVGNEQQFAIRCAC